MKFKRMLNSKDGTKVKNIFELKNCIKGKHIIDDSILIRDQLNRQISK